MIYSAAKHDLNYQFSYNSEETESLHQSLNNALQITESDLRRVSLWKMNRVLSVSEDILLKLTTISAKDSVSIQDVEVKEIINGLVDSQGIGFPMASSILKFIRPDVFPIIDVRAYRALTGEKLIYSSYSYDIYSDYAKKIAAIAIELDRPIREIDEQLYCFDKKYNGKI